MSEDMRLYIEKYDGTRWKNVEPWLCVINWYVAWDFAPFFDVHWEHLFFWGRPGDFGRVLRSIGTTDEIPSDASQNIKQLFLAYKEVEHFDMFSYTTLPNLLNFDWTKRSLEPYSPTDDDEPFYITCEPWFPIIFKLLKLANGNYDSIRIYTAINF